MADRMSVKSSSSGDLWETHFVFMPMILSKEQSHLLLKVSYACRRVEETRISGNVSTGMVWVLPGILFILEWFSSDCRDVTVFHILVMELWEYPGNVLLLKSLPQLPFLLLEIKIDLFPASSFLAWSQPKEFALSRCLLSSFTKVGRLLHLD